MVLEHVQAAGDGSGNGVLASLPCGPFTGSVGAGGGSRYQVNIDYFQVDPKGHDQDAAWIAANRINCISGGGTLSTPSYALLRALGTDQATGAFTAVPTRSLTATYKFEISNQNIPGGNIRTYKGAKELCLDAGSSSPAAGTNIQMQACVVGSLQHVAGLPGQSGLAAAVGLGDLPTEEPVLLVNEEQDEDRRKFERGKDGEHV